ncbi:MAG: BamA/TamA family outer membrane protein [Elusimicrobia bacterium]|nr:BamA/TamA family outer membrane protein [Elusimicrobiota bacterium]
MTLLLLFCLRPASAWSQSASTQPVVAEIRVAERLDVFDPRVPGEAWWGFQIANKIHVTTRERIIRQEILLRPGDPWDELKALESERNLRALGSFRWAMVTAVPRPDGKVDVLAKAQDSWTTIPNLSIGTEGGQNFFAYGIQENNLFGYNKSVSLLHYQNGPTVRNDLRYTDPRLLATRLRLSALAARTSHGDSTGLDLARPFYALDTPYAYGAGWTRLIDEDTLYRSGQNYSQFLEYTRSFMLSAGRRLGSGEALTQRLEAGWLYSKSRFDSEPGTLAGTMPPDRELSGPTLGYSWIQPRYIKETYVDRMERVEDYNLGNELSFLGGYAGTHLQSDRERWIFNATDQQGLSLGEGRFALAQVGAAGRVAGGDWENALLFTNLDLFWKSERPVLNTWVAHLEGATVRRMDKENQVVLGGDTGLRGYENNAFTGAKAFLANVENRFFAPGEYLHLVRVGGAVFFDSGAVAPEGAGLSLRSFKSDVGMGLRLASTRSRSGGVLRVDLAYALDQGPGPSRWVVSIRGGQAFSIFNSATRRLRRPPTSRLDEVAPPGFPDPR